MTETGVQKRVGFLLALLLCGLAVFAVPVVLASGVSLRAGPFRGL
jgi:hypothetical protein